MNEFEKEVTVSQKPLLKAILGLPKNPIGVVIFAHGSGSGRLSPRNQYVAQILQSHNIATLLMDLLEEGEEINRANVFDIDLLADRLISAKQWLKQQPDTQKLKIGYFGASTGAGAALMAAALEPEEVCAIVSRGGRPDLAGDAYLQDIQIPTLMIVGGEDGIVIDLNQSAYDKLGGIKSIKIIPGATHLFEEPGTLEQVADFAAEWFRKYFYFPNTSN